MGEDTTVGVAVELLATDGSRRTLGLCASSRGALAATAGAPTAWELVPV